MNTITISEQAAQVCLDVLTDWLDYVDTLDAKTRREIIALDELVNALDAEEWLVNKAAEEQARAIEMNRKFHEEQAAKAGKK